MNAIQRDTALARAKFAALRQPNEVVSVHIGNHLALALWVPGSPITTAELDMEDTPCN